MNESKSNDTEDTQVSEGTLALQAIAAEVERERAERGHSELDGFEETEARAMADEAALSEDNPDADGDTREDHAAGAVRGEGRVERDVAAVLNVTPTRVIGPRV